MRTVSNKSCRKTQNTHFMFSKFFFSKIVPFMCRNFFWKSCRLSSVTFLSKIVPFMLSNIFSKIVPFIFSNFFSKIVPFMFSNFFLFRKSCRLWDNVADRGSPQMRIWLMCIVFWIPKATNTHTDCVILIVFRCNSGWMDAPQCYVVRTLPVWFSVSRKMQCILAPKERPFCNSVIWNRHKMQNCTVQIYGFCIINFCTKNAALHNLFNVLFFRSFYRVWRAFYFSTRLVHQLYELREWLMTQRRKM
jgi:hypothetical protein